MSWYRYGITIRLDDQQWLHLADKWKEHVKIGNKWMQKFVSSGATVIQNNIQSRTPRNTGHLAQSIKRPQSLAHYGAKAEISTEVPYGEHVEFGRRAGSPMPPIDAIEYWVIRKGLPGDSRKVAYLIARTIARRGIMPRSMFRIGTEVSLREVFRLFDEHIEKMIQEWFE